MYERVRPEFQVTPANEVISLFLPFCHPYVA
jgi:hypothetical protein